MQFRLVAVSELRCVFFFSFRYFPQHFYPRFNTHQRRFSEYYRLGKCYYNLSWTGVSGNRLTVLSCSSDNTKVVLTVAYRECERVIEWKNVSKEIENVLEGPSDTLHSETSRLCIPDCSGSLSSLTLSSAPKIGTTVFLQRELVLCQLLPALFRLRRKSNSTGHSTSSVAASTLKCKWKIRTKV